MTKNRTSETILVPLESWLYLNQEDFKERMGKPMSKSFLEWIIKGFNHSATNGFIRIMDCTLSYNIDKAKQILDKAGLYWKDGGTMEYIDL